MTTDFFAYDNARNTYGLQGLGSAVEMDDALLGWVCSSLPNAPDWLAIRNASDPEMNGSSIDTEKAEAANIYKRYGYWTSIPSAIACWAAITGHK